MLGVFGVEAPRKVSQTTLSGAQLDRATKQVVAPAGAVYEAWVARYNGPANAYDIARAIAVDNSGNVYVGGHSWGTGTRLDYTTIKSNAAGNEEWVARYNGAGNGDDQVGGLAVDGSGNVYVTGFNVVDNQFHFDCVTIKLQFSRPRTMGCPLYRAKRLRRR